MAVTGGPAIKSHVSQLLCICMKTDCAHVLLQAKNPPKWAQLEVYKLGDLVGDLWGTLGVLVAIFLIKSGGLVGSDVRLL